MIPHHVYYQLAIVGFLWLCLMLHYIWPSRDTVLLVTGRMRVVPDGRVPYPPRGPSGYNFPTRDDTRW
jgi:hypothetical protein